MDSTHRVNVYSDDEPGDDRRKYEVVVKASDKGTGWVKLRVKDWYSKEELLDTGTIPVGHAKRIHKALGEAINNAGRF
jgi:hypothetical protein